MNDRVDIAALRRERDELRDELERRTEESKRRPARRARRPWSRGTKRFVVAALALAVIVVAPIVAAQFLFTQTGTTTTTPTPVVGSAALSMGTVGACTTPGPCDGILMTASPSGAAITQFGVVSITASWTATGVGFAVSGVWLVPSGTTACGKGNSGILPLPGAGQPAVSIPSTAGLITVISGSAYNYCVYSTAIPGNTAIGVSISYATA